MQAVLALMNQSLQQDCRQVSTGFLRAAAVALLLVTLMIANAAGGTATGLGFASWLLWLDYAGITLAGFSWFATSITEEREQRTLGVLRMTGVNSLSLLLGKWLPRLVVVQVLLAIQIPLAVLAVTMGGVTRYQLFAAYIALFSYTVLMSGVGLLWSTVCSHSRRASYCAAFTWATIVIGPPLTKLIVSGVLFNGPLVVLPEWLLQPILFVADAVHQTSLFRRMGWILAIGFGEPLVETQVISNLLTGLGAFGLAWFLLEYVVVYNVESPTRKPFRFPRVVTVGRSPKKKPGVKRPSRIDRCWRWALAWKEFHFVTGGWTWIVTKFVFYPTIAVIAIGIASGGGSMSFRQIWGQMAGGIFMFLGGVGLMFEFTGMAGRIFGLEIHSKTIRELMTLPVSVAGMGYTKLAGCLLALIPAAATFTFGCVIRPDFFANFVDNWFSFAGLLFTVWYCFFVHLATYLAIHFRTGALLLAFLACWFLVPITEALSWFVFGGRSDTGLIPTMAVLGLAASALLHYRIGVDVMKKGQA